MPELDNLPTQNILITKMHAFLRKEYAKERVLLKSMNEILNKIGKQVLDEQEQRNLQNFLDISPEQMQKLGDQEIKDRISNSLKQSAYKNDLEENKLAILSMIRDKIKKLENLSFADQKFIISSVAKQNEDQITESDEKLRKIKDQLLPGIAGSYDQKKFLDQYENFIKTADDKIKKGEKLSPVDQRLLMGFYNKIKIDQDNMLLFESLFRTNRDLLTNQLSKVLKQSGYRDPFDIINARGICRGLSVLWSYGKILEDKGVENNKTGLDDITFMRNTADKLANWDEKTDLDKQTTLDITRFISNIRTYQSSINKIFEGDDDTLNELNITNDTDYKKELTPLKARLIQLNQKSNSQGLGMFEALDNNKKLIENIDKKISYSAVFDKTDRESLAKLKKKLVSDIKSNSMCIISLRGKKSSHAVAAYETQNHEIYFYDPNYGEKKFNDIEQLTNEILLRSKELYPEMKDEVHFGIQRYDFDHTQKNVKLPNLFELMQDALESSKNEEKKKLAHKLKNTRAETVLDILVDANEHQNQFFKMFNSHSLKTKSAQALLNVIKKNPGLFKSISEVIKHNHEQKGVGEFDKKLQEYIKETVRQRKNIKEGIKS